MREKNKQRGMRAEGRGKSNEVSRIARERVGSLWLIAEY